MESRGQKDENKILAGGGVAAGRFLFGLCIKQV